LQAPDNEGNGGEGGILIAYFLVCLAILWKSQLTPLFMLACWIPSVQSITVTYYPLQPPKGLTSVKTVKRMLAKGKEQLVEGNSSTKDAA
jgi:hypothetical protein